MEILGARGGAGRLRSRLNALSRAMCSTFSAAVSSVMSFVIVVVRAACVGGVASAREAAYNPNLGLELRGSQIKNRVAGNMGRDGIVTRRSI